ncbi:MAG: dksA [Acidimicrobiaceae bacterium]|nr:dksA [Acidimicrobiaceae bacterium]
MSVPVPPAWPSGAGAAGGIDLHEERALASARASALAAELEAVIAASEGMNLDDEHDPEGATVAFERQRLAALLASARTAVAELDAALARADTGAFGRCESCGGEIGAERLGALPTTRRCAACATAPAPGRLVRRRGLP